MNVYGGGALPTVSVPEGTIRSTLEELRDRMVLSTVVLNVAYVLQQRFIVTTHLLANPRHLHSLACNMYYVTWL